MNIFLDVLLAIANYNDGNPFYLTQMNSALSLCAGIASFAARRRLDPLVVVMEKKTRNSAIADKPARLVYRSLKVTKHSTIP